VTTKVQTSEAGLTWQKCEICGQDVHWDNTPKPVHDDCVTNALKYFGISKEQAIRIVQENLSFGKIIADSLAGAPIVSGGDRTHELCEEIPQDGAGPRLVAEPLARDGRKIRVD